MSANIAFLKRISEILICISVFLNCTSVFINCTSVFINCTSVFINCRESLPEIVVSDFLYHDHPPCMICMANAG